MGERAPSTCCVPWLCCHGSAIEAALWNTPRGAQALEQPSCLLDKHLQALHSCFCQGTFRQKHTRTFCIGNMVSRQLLPALSQANRWVIKETTLSDKVRLAEGTKSVFCIFCTKTTLSLTGLLQVKANWLICNTDVLLGSRMSANLVLLH